MSGTIPFLRRLTGAQGAAASAVVPPSASAASTASAANAPARWPWHRDAARAAPSTQSLLRPLGVVGYDALEPALLAALATGEPLLLVSDHGAAKTLLLVRLAGALGVTLRHYNASILQFDDLAGFPVPDDAGGIRYAAPPGAIWDADAVFFDEIGRCRPETANKLFPIVHERRIQGIELERLRFRWAATNPPPEAQSTDDGAAEWARYEGVEALDPALADRFSYVVALPRFADLCEADRALIVAGVGERLDPAAAGRAREMVAATQALLPSAEVEVGEAATAYVLALVSRLANAGLAAGGRRAATMRRNVIAMRAACIVLGREGIERACCAAVLASVPDVVRRRVSRATLLAAHEAAWRETSLPETDPRRALLAVREPARRAVLALTLPGLRTDLRGEAMCGALAELPRHEAEILAWHLLPRVSGGGLVPGTAAETVAMIVEEGSLGGTAVVGFGTQRTWATTLRSRLAISSVPRAEVEFLHGVLVRAALAPQSVTGFDIMREVAVAVERTLAFRAECLASLGELELPIEGAR